MNRVPGIRRRRWPPALALLLALFGGCAAAPELVWQRVDDAIVERADDWLDLDEQQQQRLRDRLLPWLEQTRRERMRRYAAFLREFADRIEPDIALADLRWAVDRADALYVDTMDSFLPVIAPTLAGLSTAQRRHLARRIEERNHEYRADYVDGRDDGRYAIAERLIEAVERWTGELRPRQRELVHTRVRELPRMTPEWYRWRQEMQRQLLARIERGAGPRRIEQTLRSWWIGRGRDAPALRREELRAALLPTLAELARALDSGQRAEARRLLRARAGSLQTLADTLR